MEPRQRAGSFYSPQGYDGAWIRRRWEQVYRRLSPPFSTFAMPADGTILSGARSLYAIHQWGRCQNPVTVRAMGFGHAKTPAVPCLHRVFSDLDVTAFEAVVARWS